MFIDWNHERHRTRDLLLEYADFNFLPQPLGPESDIVYPSGHTIFGGLDTYLYQLAKKSGYTDTEENFKLHFGEYLMQNSQQIVYDLYVNFPEIGSKNKLYFDLNDKILYYWDNDYIPVNALLIANTILEGGDA